MVDVQRQSQFQGSPVLVALGSILSVSMVSLLVAQSKRKKLLPGPYPWPILGNLPALTARMPHHVLRTLGEKYGGLMYLQLRSVQIIVFNRVELSTELFQTRDQVVFLHRARMLGLTTVYANYQNPVASSGRYWRELRKLVTAEVFTAKRLASHLTVSKRRDSQHDKEAGQR
jgi:hypothetical protein